MISVGVSIRKTLVQDYPFLISLYKDVASESGGIIRTSDEISFDYVNTFIELSLKKGLSLVAIQNDNIVGEIHAYTPEIHAFRHMLSDLTIVVHPEYQRSGIGRTLFKTFLEKVMLEYPHILRVELYVREESTGIIQFYESLGFINEGRHKNKILNAHNDLETPLHMAWFNPGFKQHGA